MPPPDRDPGPTAARRPAPGQPRLPTAPDEPATVPAGHPVLPAPMADPAASTAAGNTADRRATTPEPAGPPGEPPDQRGRAAAQGGRGGLRRAEGPAPVPVAVTHRRATDRRTTGRGSAGARTTEVREPAVTGHGHSHGSPPPAGRRVRLAIAGLLVPCALATLVGLVLLWPTGPDPSPAANSIQQVIDAQVLSATPAACTPGTGSSDCAAVVVRMTDGPLPGRDLVQLIPLEPGTPVFTEGDPVVLGWSGVDPTDPSAYQVIDFQRGTPLVWLAVAFAAAVLALGRWRGLASLAGLGVTFAVLLYFVLPAILAGRDPLTVAVVGSGVIMFAVLYLVHGLSARTSVAVLGTLASLTLIGLLGAGFAAATSLTGLDDQTSNLISTLGSGVDARGLLLAGIVIGALGVLDDVTITQSSAVWELRRANPELGATALFTSAMRIGRDHVAAAVNTLVLAYAGAALPLMLLFTVSQQDLGTVVTSELIATEVVRTLVGSIGLIASVPITSGLAALVASRESRELLGAG